MKIGIDIHGVIDDSPELFSGLTKRLLEDGHEVHILTGVEHGDRIIHQLDELNIVYTHFFSITSYHKEIGTPITYGNGDKDKPLISPEIWDRTKADYAERVGLDIHIDDSEVYGAYFTGKTKYLIFGRAGKFLFELIANVGGV